MSLNSVTSTRTSSKSSPMFATIEKKIVPGIGIVSQTSEGAEVIYPDGSRLAVGRPDHGGGVTFVQRNGDACHYSAKEELPDILRRKLTEFQTVLKQLVAQQPSPHRINNCPSVPMCTPVSNRCMQPQIKFFR